MNDSPIRPSPASPTPPEPQAPPARRRRRGMTPARCKLFTAVFFALCLFPTVGKPFLDDEGPVGNERLAPWPSLTTAEGKPNPKVLSQYADFFNDHIAGRHTMITANSVLTAMLFRVLTNQDVILGTDGWLYYAETLPDYLGVSRMSERECYAAARTLHLIQQYVAQQGARFVFTIAPNKNSLYPEHMPARYPRSDLPHNAERLATRLADLAVPYVDLFAALRSVDETLYYTTDSHWTNRGAALAGDILSAALATGASPNPNPDPSQGQPADSFPEQLARQLSGDCFFPTSYTMADSHWGDLYRMVYPAGKQAEADAVFDRGFTFRYGENYHSPEDVRITTTNPGHPGRLVMFRDSFGNALHPFLAERFGQALFSRATPYDLTTVAREQADTVILELVERNLSTLCTRAPLLPAPVCPTVFLDTGKETPTRDGAVARASCQDSDRLTGYCQITGNVVCDGLDDESTILVQLGGTLYEATPAGEGDDPFTLYVPGTAADIGSPDPGQAAPIVIVTANGQETVCPLLWE